MNTLHLLVFVFFSFTQGLIQEPTCDGTSEYFPHENCSLFYQCFNGQPFLVPCPDGLYWNDQFNTCDFPSNVPECVGGTRPPVGTPTTTQLTSEIPTTTEPVSTTETDITDLPTKTYPTTKPTTTRPTTTLRTTPFPQRPGCGEILTEPIGTISYKESEEYQPYERCIWIIKVPGSIRINFKMEKYGIIGLSDGVMVSSMIFGDKWTNYTVPKVTSDRLYFEGNIASQNADVSGILFYSSKYGPSKGFRLSYEVETGDFIRPGSVQILTDVPSQLLSYPETGLYENDELSTFVYSPRFSFYPDVDINTLFKIKTMEPYYDTLYVYTFHVIQGSSTPVWRQVDRLDMDSSNKIVTTNDTTLILFKTDKTVVGEGFTLDFSLDL